MIEEIISRIDIILGWVLGIFTPFILAPINRWQDKRNFKKILKSDINLKIDELKSIKNSLIDFVKGETFADVIKKIKGANMLGGELPEIHQEIGCV